MVSRDRGCTFTRQPFFDATGVSQVVSANGIVWAVSRLLPGRQAGQATIEEKAHIRVTGVLTAVPNSLKPDETICWLDVAKIERR